MSDSHHSVQAPAVTAGHLVNKPAPNTPYFTPLQNPRAGTAILAEGKKDVPKLFRPLKIRGLVRSCDCGTTSERTLMKDRPSKTELC